MFEPHYGIEKMAFEHGNNLRRIKGESGHWSRKTVRMILTAAISLLLISGCTITPLIEASIDKARLSDGTYQGFYEGGLNSALVEVTILNREIVDAAVLEHDTLLGKKAEDIIIREILEAQSTEVDSVSGATNSSHVIINAAQIALEKAYQE